MKRQSETLPQRQKLLEELLRPQGRNTLFWRLSRLAALLALVCVLLGVIADAAGRKLGLTPLTWLLLGLYVLGVQIYFLMAHFVETGAVE